MKLKPKEIQRFWANVLKNSWLYPDCWIWTGFFGPKGYGRFFIGRRITGLRQRLFSAHRIAWELSRGPIPKKFQLDHLCRNRSCVNPEHLEPVTAQVNLLRGEGLPAQNAQKTHCKRGHPLSGKNLIIYGERRCCKACRYAYRRQRAKS